ncbi:site-specific DNA-methyltransferase [Sphingopyxis macrogoltabida]|jgi:adenine-specific DNA-methyltransferase|uniref:site-specific DNA-methyltransferase (adenine-specific) n=1 Tax=Sphingopyxis macrogoltabida TaxID=33050 RepID=A0A0N9V2W1_SPHMC|nr:site-specific DNA-methyltransferase [Sphingopyxis macrogoltabida]ALH83128.1 DNA methyltransferase [Sphingopyxis macrogoltabida]
MTQKTKLELTWPGKDERPKLEPRILIEDPVKSYHASVRRDGDLFDNMLIKGDNLLALKALEQKHAGEVKCVYIDPPFNTKQAFDHYDDGVEHSIWLSLMSQRLEFLHALLSPDGSIYIHIDDNELTYLTVIADEIFGRSNRISIVTFKQGSATGHKSINPGVVSTSNFILVYAKDKARWKPNKVFTARGARDKRYGQFIVNRSDPHQAWRFSTLSQAFAISEGIPEKQLKKALGDDYEMRIEAFVHANATAVIQLARPDYNAVSAAARSMIDQSRASPNEIILLERESHSNMYFVGGQRILFYADKLKFVDGEYVAGEPLTSIWDDILSNNLHNEGGVDFPKGKKPEALIKRCFDLSTNPGDLVLDSFAGSGTTGAVAHKMGRRWIMVEIGEHADSHVVPRLQKVIDGTDPGGISKAVDWKGGGGFRYFTLAPSLLERDKYGNWVIAQDYNPAMLAEAMCKHMGFTYVPSQDPAEYWRHGHSTETDFIYVTTQALTHEACAKIAHDVGPDRSLLICCKAYDATADAFENLTLVKIPTSILQKCEWGRDDYSLNIQNLPQAEDEEASEAAAQAAGAGLPLFAEEADDE